MMRVIALPLLIALSVARAAESPNMAPPPWPLGEALTWKPLSRSKPVTLMRMGTFTVQLEKTTLPELLSVAGAGTIAHAGDAAESTYWLCYTVTGNPITARIWISANGEMGGPELLIGAIAAEVAERGAAVPACPELPSKLQPLALDHDIWIGTAAKSLPASLGNPSIRKSDWQDFFYQGKASGDCDGGSDVLNNLTLRTHHGRVEAIFASQVTSC
jgi:hypothetical protein